MIGDADFDESQRFPILEFSQTSVPCGGHLEITANRRKGKVEVTGEAMIIVEYQGEHPEVKEAMHYEDQKYVVAIESFPFSALGLNDWKDIEGLEFHTDYEANRSRCVQHEDYNVEADYGVRSFTANGDVIGERSIFKIGKRDGKNFEVTIDMDIDWLPMEVYYETKQRLVQSAVLPLKQVQFYSTTSSGGVDPEGCKQLYESLKLPNLLFYDPETRSCQLAIDDE